MSKELKKLHQYFDKTYVINLDRRKDRLNAVTNRCKELDIEFEKISAIDGKINKIPITNQSYYWSHSAAALSMTFLNKIKQCKENGIGSVLFMEDDVEFNPDIHKILDKCFEHVPENWEMLYFGGNHNLKTTKITDNLHRCNRTYTTHCYAINSNAYDIIIKELEKFDNPVDWKFGHIIHPRGNSYVFRPHLAYQAEDFSDIIDKKVNYSFLRK